MFDHTSRYHRVKEGRLTLADGREVAYKMRRFLPRGDDMPLMAVVRSGQGDRLDLVAHRVLGDPTQFWRICDANDVMDPLELETEDGREIKIPIPQDLP
jgi:hypothetical protein